MPPLLIASGEACLRDCAVRFDRDITRPLLAEFCGVTKDTAGRWLNHRNLPKGDPLLKLRVFLQVLGYQVDEVMEPPEPVRRLLFGLAFGVLELGEVQKQLRFVNLQSLYHVLLRNGGLMPDKAPVLKRLVADHESEIATAEKRWRSRLEAEYQLSTHRPAGASDETRRQNAIVTRAPMTPVEVTSHLLKAISPLVEEFNTPDPRNIQRRELLRHQVGGADQLTKLITGLEHLLL